MVKLSLKQQLQDWIKRDGEVSWTDVVYACNSGKFGRTYKPSNGERRLRASESPEIETVMSENGKYIKSYRHKNPIKWKEVKVINPMTGQVERIIRLPI